MYQSGDRLLLAQGNTMALKVALCAMRSVTISYASCAMCYALCDDFLCVMRDVLCALRRFPVRRGACSVGPLKDLRTHKTEQAGSLLNAWANDELGIVAALFHTQV